MYAYSRAFGLWGSVEADEEPQPLPDNPTIPQIHIPLKATTKRYKTLTCIHAISEEIFTRTMTCEISKLAREKPKEEYKEIKDREEFKFST